jgi:hypothetical protein
MGKTPSGEWVVAVVPVLVLMISVQTPLVATIENLHIGEV